MAERLIVHGLSSVPFPLRSAALPPQIVHEVHRQLAVLASLRSCERLHDLLVVAHYLALVSRLVRLPFLALKPLRLSAVIAEMPDLPSFMRRAMNPARGRDLDPMLA